MSLQPEGRVPVLIEHKWKIILAAIILLITALFLYILLPLLDGIILGIVLAYVARPLKHYLDRYIPKLSPYIATFAIVFPVILIIGLGIIEIFNQIIWAIKNQDYVVRLLLNIVERFNPPASIYNRVKDIILNFASYILPLIQQLSVGTITSTFTMLMITVINIIIAIALCFYLLVDGSRLVEELTDLIPQEINDFSKRFLVHLDGILSAIFVGNTYSAIAVGLLSLIVFSAFGFSNVLALSALMLLAAIVPIFTGWMVVIPLTIYRYFEMGSTSAIIFFVVSILTVMAPPDLLIRPYIIHFQSRIHPMLIIIAFVGGGLVGGIAGFFIAPILLGAIIAAYRTHTELEQDRNLKPV